MAISTTSRVLCSFGKKFVQQNGINGFQKQFLLQSVKNLTGSYSVKKYFHTFPILRLSDVVCKENEARRQNRRESEAIEAVEKALDAPSLGRLFAVVHLNGVQRKVTTEDLVVIQGDFHPDVGDSIRLEKVLLVGGKDFTLVGRPILSRQQVNVEATVVEKTLSNFFYRQFYMRKRRYKTKARRRMYSMLVINKIEVNSHMEI